MELRWQSELDVDWEGIDKINTMMKVRAIKHKMHVRVLLLVVVGGIVFGIIGMHGLSNDHSTGTAHAAVAPQSLPSGATPADAMGGHDQHGNDHSDLGEHCGMLALCLGALAGGALLLWAAFVALRRRPMALLKRSSTAVRAQMRSIFRPAPDLISLSILRC